MISFYAIRPKFFHTLSTHPDLLKDLFLLSQEQKEFILETISQEELRQSAISFFEVPIYEEDEKLHLKMPGEMKGSIHIHDGIAEMDTTKNPFFELLKRKYPCHIIESMK